MRLKSYLLLFLAGAFLTTSCNQKEFYDQPTTSSLLLKLDDPSVALLPLMLSLRHPDGTLDETSLTTPTYQWGGLTAGNYTLTAWTPTENVTVANGCATLATLSDGTLAQPASFAYCTSSFDLRTEEETSTLLTLSSAVHTLSLTINVAAAYLPRIDRVDATLTGLLTSIPFDAFVTRSSSPGGTTRFHFARGTESLTADVHLLGIVTDTQQTLTLTVTYTNGFTQTVTQDITAALKDFNDRPAASPFALQALLALPDPISGATLGEWQTSQSPNPGEAEMD